MPGRDLEQARQWNRQRYQRRKANHQCTHCGQPSKQTLCPTHQAANARYKDNTPWGKSHIRRTYATKWNPYRNNIILQRLYKFEPLLKRDWATAKPWIEQHIELWNNYSQFSECLQHLDLTKLRDIFNIYLDGAPNYRENGIRLGSYNTD